MLFLFYTEKFCGLNVLGENRLEFRPRNHMLEKCYA